MGGEGWIAAIDGYNSKGPRSSMPKSGVPCAEYIWAVRL